jgi:hypothetical protein
MQRSEWNFEGPMDDDKCDAAWPQSPEERVDRLAF